MGSKGGNTLIPMVAIACNLADYGTTSHATRITLNQEATVNGKWYFLATIGGFFGPLVAELRLEVCF